MGSLALKVIGAKKLVLFSLLGMLHTICSENYRTVMVYKAIHVRPVTVSHVDGESK